MSKSVPSLAVAHEHVQADIIPFPSRSVSDETASAAQIAEIGQDLEKPSDNKGLKRAKPTRSRIPFPAQNPISRTTCTPFTHVAFLADPAAFLAHVAATSVRKLREEFPHEHSCHTAILGRAKKGDAAIAEPIRSLKGFLEALGPAPSEAHSVDRVDTFDPEYAPAKIRWADPKEQARNRITTIFLTRSDGRKAPLVEWAEETGQAPDTMRLHRRQGWTDDEVIAGTRDLQTSAPVADEFGFSSASGWPKISPPSAWEPHYQRWFRKKANSHPAATRLVFWTWIVANRRKVCARVLSDRYPNAYGPEADPDMPDEHAEVVALISDGYFKYLQTTEATFRHARSLLFRRPNEYNVYRNFLDYKNNVLYQEKASEC